MSKYNCNEITSNYFSLNIPVNFSVLIYVYNFLTIYVETEEIDYIADKDLTFMHWHCQKLSKYEIN